QRGLDSGAKVRLPPADPRAGRRGLRFTRGAGAQNRTSEIGGSLMQLGMVGLGRMGSGMTERLDRDGHDVKTYDPKVPSTAGSLQELAPQRETARPGWQESPAGVI